MKRMKVLLENDFHATAIWVTVNMANGELSDSQKRKVWKALCGHDACQCGGPCGVRPPYQLEQIDYQRIKVHLA